MPKPYDATTKFLVEMHPADWLAFLGLPDAPVTVVDADLATVTTDADRLLAIGNPVSSMLHLEFEAGHGARSLPGRLLRYNVLSGEESNLPVRSVAILLRPEADGPALTGVLEYRHRDGDAVYLTFRYTVIRMWEIPVETLLTGGLSLLPLAPIGRGAAEALPETVERMAARIEAEASTEQQREIWAAAFILMGLKYPPSVTSRIVRRMGQMKESVTYQQILHEGLEQGLRQGREEGREEGELEGIRQTILSLGRRRLGEPTPKVLRALQAARTAKRLNALADRLLDVETWDEWLA